MAVRKISPKMPFDDRRREILFTGFAAEADPLAQPVTPLLEGWLDDNEHARAATLAADEAEMRSDALRAVANTNLDIHTRQFGRDLEHRICSNDPNEKKPQQRPEFRQFFPVSPSVFVRLPFREQVARVGAWITAGAHAVLDLARPHLAEWHGRATAALQSTAESSVVRGRAQVVREQHAEDLTRSRDAVWRALAEIADDNALPRTWADTFFRKERSDADAEPTTTGESEAA